MGQFFTFFGCFSGAFLGSVGRGHRPERCFAAKDTLAIDPLCVGLSLRNSGAPSLRSYRPERLHREAPLKGASPGDEGGLLVLNSRQQQGRPLKNHQ